VSASAGAPGAVQAAEGPRLARLEEPEAMRDALREAVLAGADWREGFADDVCVGVWIWEAWRAALEPAGMSREAFVDVVVGYRRELWLWLVGERGWEPFLAGLAGRVARRIPLG